MATVVAPDAALRASRFFRSSIGAKFAMALTGLGLVGFVFMHMVGNLQIFLGPEAINRYAAFLKGLGELLWVARLGLLAMVAVHVASAVRLVKLNREARPVAYQFSGSVQLSYASRTMPMSGVIILAFLVYHLLHFTVGSTHPEYFALHDEWGRHDVYSMVVLSFQSWTLVGFYVLAQALLCMHLSHGVSSLFQSLGINFPAANSVIRGLGPAVAWTLFVGNVSIPLACALGFVLPAVGAHGS